MNPTKLAIGMALALWFALVVILGAMGVFDTPASALPLPLLLGVAAPISAFVALFRKTRRFRDVVLAIDLRLTAAMQAWRFAGFGFLALYAYGVLPGVFAWPAGLGDMAIALSAPWVVKALVERPAFAASRRFIAWHVLGLLDFSVAIATGVLGSGTAIGMAHGVTTDAMGRLPLVLIPCFFVPLFVMLHLTAIFQARRLSAHALLITRPRGAMTFPLSGKGWPSI